MASGNMPSRGRTPCRLHGTLDVTIYETRGLSFGLSGSNLRPMEIKRITTSVRSLTRRLSSQFKRFMLSRPEIVDLNLYATVDLGKTRVGRTDRVKVQRKNSNPIWNEQFNIYCAHDVLDITFTIKDDNPISATLIGRAHVPAEDVSRMGIYDGWVDIVDEYSNPIDRNKPQVHVRIQFKDVTQDANWSQGIKNPNFEGVPRTPFQQKKGCAVTLYQDAHVGDDFRPRINVSGLLYKPQRCWEDIYGAIENARHLIYIAGWSMNAKITLVRDFGRTGYNERLGDLLRRKADEGVPVLVLLWDDRTSVHELKRDGLMDTHDEETFTYLKKENSKVHCVLCPRVTDTERSMVQEFTGSTIFTHHQKMVVVDAEVPGGGNRRRIVSFIGGIDLCDGRYDTQDHPLFKTLNTIHKDDFHQPNFAGASVEKGGPREPWHDIHCRLEGPVAWDVLYNFEDRWAKQAGSDAQFIVPRDRFKEIPILRESPSSDSDSWNVQLFRSIDGGAVGFNVPSKMRENPAAHGLVTEKDCIIERSIQDAYINAIRRAKNFIYIENQYFLGSSFGWKSDTDAEALHLIPKELSLKIVSKIKAGERFAVYVVIPMWPEGVPESESVQEILYWQRRTMEMMYSDITLALSEKGSSANPRDYLTFFCLGNREPNGTAARTPEPNTDYARAQQARRFMIYVHSKMMIVDDEYIIVGSANINQRSMDGARDTEIAMGAFQPNHLAATQPARGLIYGFRTSLWYEHLGFIDNIFDYPESLRCIQKLNERAGANWKLYTSSALTDRDRMSHLLQYPIEINRDGTLSTVSDIKNFPDTEAPILGSKAKYLPANLTT